MRSVTRLPSQIASVVGGQITRAGGDTPIISPKATVQGRWSDDGILETQAYVLEDAGVRELLDHQNTMTQTLIDRVNHRNPIEVNKILGPFDDDKGIRTRVVVLKDKYSDRILSLGLIKIHLDNLSLAFERDLGETYTPFGELLKKHSVSVIGEVQKFYRMSTSQQKRDKLFF